jgi:glycosyltransferase involved in cell wall biosynthesis
MKCSVVMPVYDAGAPLGAAIESILRQVEPNFELLIIDDCSSDGSSEVIRHYAAADQRIRAIFHNSNRGLAATLNEALAEADGELVVRMDQDDLALTDRLAVQLNFMELNPDIAVAGTFVYHMGRTPAWDHLIRLPVSHE